MRRRSMTWNSNYLSLNPTRSVIIHDFNTIRTMFRPDKADSVLVVNPNTELATPLTRKCLQPVAGRDTKLIKLYNRIKLVKFSNCNSPQILWASFSRCFSSTSVEDVFRSGVPKAGLKVNGQVEASEGKLTSTDITTPQYGTPLALAHLHDITNPG